MLRSSLKKATVIKGVYIFLKQYIECKITIHSKMVKLCKNVHKTTIYECSSFKSRHRRRACWLSGRPCRTSLPDIPGSVSLDPGSRQCSPFCHSCPPVTLNKKIWPIIALCWVDFAATVALSLFSDQHHNITNLTHFPPRRPDNIIEVAQSATLHLKHLPNQKSLKLLEKKNPVQPETW